MPTSRIEGLLASFPKLIGKNGNGTCGIGFDEIGFG
jgi:hypothetical protein